MSARLKTIVCGVLLAAAVGWLYARRLSDAPVYLSPDEAIIAVDAHTLATTAHDGRGVLLPLYFRIQMPGEERFGWFTPAIFYWSALFVKALPFSEATVRLSTVAVGLIDIVLMYFAARRLFGTSPFALLAAGLLALTPAHFILSRYELDYLYPLPFVLGWFLCLATWIERDRPVWLAAAAACLAVGFYSYISSVLMMPVYFGLTLLLLVQRRTSASQLAIAATAFAVPLLPFVTWLIAHPTAFTETAQRYELYDAKKLNALQGLREYLSYPNLDRLSALYWSFFSPSFLFFSGDSQMMFSTRAIGVFVLPFAILIPIGAYHIVRHRTTPMNLLVLAGFVTAPVAAVLVPEPATIIRAVAILPFGALLATFGVEALWDARLVERPRPFILSAGVAALVLAAVYGMSTMISGLRVSRSTMILLLASVALFALGRAADRMKLGRVIAVCLLAAIPIQFGGFCRDYFTDYRSRSTTWLGGNLRGALETLIALEGRDHAPSVYFSALRSTSGLLDIRNRWMDAYWRFYLIKAGREDLLAKSGKLPPGGVEGLPAGSLVLANVGDTFTESLVAAGRLKQRAVIPEMDKPGFFVILER